MTAFDGKEVLVTGAVGDIGSAICRRLISSGAKVWGIDVHQLEEARERSTEIAEGSLNYLQADVSNFDRVSEVILTPDHLDIVIGNAGIVEAAKFIDLTPDSWRRHLNVNLTGNFNVGQAAARRFISEGTPGRIIFTGSWVGEHPWPEISAYAITKAGIAMLAKSMALELASSRIKVNVVAPGIVNAGLARQEADRNPEYAARVSTAIPLGVMQSVDDVASAVMFLCGPESENITGSTLLVDGGCSLGSR